MVLISDLRHLLSRLHCDAKTPRELASGLWALAKLRAMAEAEEWLQETGSKFLESYKVQCGPPSYKLVCWNCWRVVLEAFLTTLELSDLNLWNCQI